MIYPEWRQQLVRSFHLHRSKPEAKYFQMASVDEKGAPCVRTMVFRDFQAEHNCLLSVSDTRSEKYVQLCKRPTAELHWYFAKSREQYRIRSKVRMISIKPKLESNIDKQDPEDLLVQGADSQSISEYLGSPDYLRPEAALDVFKARWQKLSSGAQNSFFAPRPKSNKTESEAEKTISIESFEGISQYFMVVIFTPTEVDYLDLKQTPHHRQLSTLSAGRWQTQTVNP